MERWALGFAVILAACGGADPAAEGAAASGGGSAAGAGASAGSGGVAGGGGAASAGGSAGAGASAGTSSGGSGNAAAGGAAGAGGAGGDFAGITPTAVVVVGDSDRDGDVDPDDVVGHGAWSWKRGAFLLANVDDDDGDAKSDASDGVINGTSDGNDLAPLRIELGSTVAAAASSLSVTWASGAEHVRAFRWDGSAWLPVQAPFAVTGSAKLGVEAKRFAGAGWNGLARLRVEARGANGSVLASDEVELRVAPWIMIPGSSAPKTVHVAKGAYANQAFLTDLTAAAATAGVTLLPPYSTTHWQEMWMQDTMEIGYTQLPGRPAMHVALRANRSADAYPKTLLGPDMGYLEVGAPRSTPGGDAWVDWYGNLEVSPPVTGWPLGRIYYGHNTSTGMMLHPAVVEFLVAQQVQSPFWIDTSWLTIKHVDEILTFVPGPAGAVRLLVVSPREAGKLYPSYYGPYNKGVQAKIDKALQGGTYVVGGKSVTNPGVLANLGLGPDAVVELPLFYTDGHNDWSNPVNGLFLGTHYLAGEAGILTPERDLTEKRIEALGPKVVWVDDAVYQKNLGNVHCATNSTRAPVTSNFAQALPASL